MLSVLDAVWQGRAFDLPPEKEAALAFLANEISGAVAADGALFAEQIIARERGHNCSIGLGVACPHAGTTAPGELICAVGWSAAGIDYEACNGNPVHLVVMYRIPEAKRGAYLQEMAAISRALKTLGEKPVTNEKERSRFFETLVEQNQNPEIQQTSRAAVSKPWRKQAKTGGR